MTKKELIKALENYHDDCIVVLVEPNGIGWSNIGFLRMDGSSIQIVEDDHPSFHYN